ncbi:hypothetical protein V6N12_061533 [Hibiscus sabdariffa]|uniref:RNase H type-1 domain-containing protein n=1 Tax=Hibiscus sabdariffa TaxID=183260 RepID=A0ABR2DXC4_9ROSI
MSLSSGPHWSNGSLRALKIREFLVTTPLRGRASSLPFSGRASHFAATISDVTMANHATVDLIQWVAPPHDWVCLNTDVAISLSNHLGSIGGVLRGPTGDRLREVQSDCSVAIRMILDPMATSSSFSLVRCISSLRNHPWSLLFLWVPLETNMVADGLSKLSSLHGFQLQIFDDIPESIRPLFVRDCDGHPYLRQH